MGTFLIGCVNGWIAPALPRLLAGEEGFNVTTNEASWLALYPEFGHFVAPIPMGIIADCVGRKMIFIYGSILNVLGWSIMSCASKLTYFYIGRTILGLNYGLQAAIMNIYIAEITDKKWRGTFGSLTFFFLNAGILFEFVIGGYFSVHTTILITAVICGIHFFLTLLIVESPYYLLTQAKKIAAKNNLKWLRAADDVDVEFCQITKRMIAKTDLITLMKNLKYGCKGFLLCFVLTFLTEFSGRTVVLTYATRNFQSQNLMSADHLTMLLGIFNVLLPMVPVVLSDKVGRRILMLVSSTIAGIMHMGTGFWYFFNSALQTEIPHFGWLLLFTITAYLCSCSVMATNVMTLRGELIAENSRGMASGFGSMGSGLAALVSIKLFQVISDSYGEDIAFWMFSGFCFINTTVVWIFLPETKNKTFEEIQKNLQPTTVEKN